MAPDLTRTRDALEVTLTPLTDWAQVCDGRPGGVPMSGAHLHSVGFHVTDLNATASFYRLLGLTVPAGSDAPVAVDLG